MTDRHRDGAEYRPSDREGMVAQHSIIDYLLTLIEYLLRYQRVWAVLGNLLLAFVGLWFTTFGLHTLVSNHFRGIDGFFVFLMVIGFAALFCAL